MYRARWSFWAKPAYQREPGHLLACDLRRWQAWIPKSDAAKRRPKRLTRKRTGLWHCMWTDDGHPYYHRHIPGLWRLRRRVAKLRRSRLGAH